MGWELPKSESTQPRYSTTSVFLYLFPQFLEHSHFFLLMITIRIIIILIFRFVFNTMSTYWNVKLVRNQWSNSIEQKSCQNLYLKIRPIQTTDLMKFLQCNFRQDFWQDGRFFWQDFLHDFFSIESGLMLLQSSDLDFMSLINFLPLGSSPNAFWTRLPTVSAPLPPLRPSASVPGIVLCRFSVLWQIMSCNGKKALIPFEELWFTDPKLEGLTQRYPQKVHGIPLRPLRVGGGDCGHRP